MAPKRYLRLSYILGMVNGKKESINPLSLLELVGLGVHLPHTCRLPRVRVLDWSKPIKMQGCCSQCRVLMRVQQDIFRLRPAEIHKRQLATGCTEYPKGYSQRKAQTGGRHYAGCKPSRVALWADNYHSVSDLGLVQGVIWCIISLVIGR